MKIIEKIPVCVFLILLLIIISCTEEAHRRVKRKILFTKNSKLFFRLNGKDNVVPWNQIFAHGWAFRINYELPETLPKRRKFFKREILEDLQNLSIMQGYSCIMKFLCQFVKSIRKSNKCGIFCKLGNLITRFNGIDVEYFMETFQKCDQHIKECRYDFHKNTYNVKLDRDVT